MTLSHLFFCLSAATADLYGVDTAASLAKESKCQHHQRAYVAKSFSLEKPN
jgi:hypothetical protein